MDSIARSHFGPVMQSPDLSEISFYLASPNISARNMDSFLWSEETEQEQGTGCDPHDNNFSI